MQIFARTQMLLGKEALETLYGATVAVFGLGGVGSYCAEALVRAGVGTLVLFDHDTIDPTNLNRQLFATQGTIGMQKTDAAARRLLEINPDCNIIKHPVFYLPENADEYDFSFYSYIVDAVDTVSAKLEIIARATACAVPVISSMGTGNKLDPTRFRVADITKTSVCPLARVMRRELKKRGISHCKVVYSDEEPLTPKESSPPPENAARRAVPGSISFVPPAAGLILAGEVIKDLVKEFLL